MHPNPAFRGTPEERALATARERGFGILAVGGDFAHVPFLLAEDGSAAEMHLVRSNPIARIGAPAPATLIVSGPDGYISPDWYEVPDQVPTWNYVAVHLIGTLHPMPPEAMEDLLARQSATYEARLPGKTPWTMDKMSAEARARMMRQILPFRLQIAQTPSTFKLNQNKPDEVRLRAARAAEGGTIGAETGRLARLMRDG